MKQYTDLLREILKRGRLKQNRTGVDTISLIDAPQMVFDMDDGFPLGTYRQIFFRGVVGENLWFLKGECNNEELLAQDIKIWDKWALKEDTPIRQPRAVQDLVESYVRAIANEQGLSEEQPDFPERMQELAGKVHDELAQADREDHEKGLPTLLYGASKPVSGPEEMEGGFRLMREKNIEFYETAVTLPKGYLGPIYGVLWRRWPSLDPNSTIDQISTILAKLKSENPKLRYSRANIVTAYHPALLPDETQNAQENIKTGRQALAACHTMFQLFAEPLTLEERFALVDPTHPNLELIQSSDEEAKLAFLGELNIPVDRLSLKLYQRSADVPVGVPFNIAGYALLLHMFATQANMKPGLFIHTLGDAHIYVDQVEGVEALLARVDDPEIEVPALPKLRIRPGVASMFEYQVEDFQLEDYHYLRPQIKFPVAE